jgi:hypothetical protein
MFAELAAAPTPTGRPKTPATLQRICATLRASYNAAIRDGIVADNPARRIEMPAEPRVQPQQLLTRRRRRRGHAGQDKYNESSATQLLKDPLQTYPVTLRR